MQEFRSESEFRDWFEKPPILSRHGIQRLLWSQNDFPDLKFETLSGKVVLAEIELKTSNFDQHGHDENQVDLVIVWIHDEPHRKRSFKVFDVSFDMRNKVPIQIDDLLNFEEDLVYRKVQRLPLIAVSSINEEDFWLINRYAKAWKIINQQDIKRFFTLDLEEIIKEFKSYIEVDKSEFISRTNHFHNWFPNRAFHPFLCFMAKAIVIRGTIQLVNEGILSVKNKHKDTITEIYSIPVEKYLGLQKLAQKQKLPFALGTFPFSSFEEKDYFYTDYADAFIGNFNFRASNSLPAVEIGLTLEELSIWERFGKKNISKEEALGQYGLKEPQFSDNEYNPMKLEFSPSRIVSFSLELASELRDYGFVEPNCSREIIKRIYDLVIQPIGVITNADKMPRVEDIEFFHYPQHRIEDTLRRFETTRGFTRKDGIKELKRFYSEYPSRFSV